MKTAHAEGMSTRRITIKAPVRVAENTAVMLTISYTPTNELHRELSTLGFIQFGYADERMGRLGKLGEAIAASQNHANPAYRKHLLLDRDGNLTLIGNVLAHARVYEPDATGAREIGRPGLPPDADIVQFQGDWAVWATVELEITV